MPEKLSERRSIWVQIKLDGDYFPDDGEFDLRYALEDAVNERGIGRSYGSGSGGGWMDFSFEIENTNALEPALTAVKGLLEEYKVPDEAARLEAFKQYDPDCDELPALKPGDCLAYRFDDNDYGAAIVLKRRTDEPHAEIEMNTGWQTGKPPVSNANETLLGLLDYKRSELPPASIFDQRNWLIRTEESSLGQPYLVWVDCFGGIEVQIVHHSPLKDDDLRECRFHLEWEDIPEYFIRDKFRGDKAHNPYEFYADELITYEPGDCLSYRFEDGDFGAALVLKRSEDGPNRLETLLGILDYKREIPPDSAPFEQRNWLISKQSWREGQPYLVWALWEPEEIEIAVVGHVAVRDDDLMICQLNLTWEDFSEFVLRNMNSGKS